MIFLYRFEALKLDGALSDADLTDYTSSDIPGRQVFLLTNYERPIDYDQAEPFAAGYLPLNLGTAGLPSARWIFQPAAISHEEVRLDNENEAGAMTVEMPTSSALVQLLKLRLSEFQLYLTVAKLDTPEATPLVMWSGTLSDLDTDEARAKLQCAHISEVLAQVGLTAKHPRNCPHSLYDRSSCGVRSLAFDGGYFKWREDGVISAISPDGMTLTVSAASNRENAFFDDGFALIEAEYAQDAGQPLFLPRESNPTQAQADKSRLNGGVRRFVIAHAGATVVLANPVSDTVQVGQRITLFSGCKKTLAVCQSKFGNQNNFGGYPLIPIRNPFETGLKG